MNRTVATLYVLAGILGLSTLGSFQSHSWGELWPYLAIAILLGSLGRSIERRTSC